MGVKTPIGVENPDAAGCPMQILVIQPTVLRFLVSKLPVTSSLALKAMLESQSRIRGQTHLPSLAFGGRPAKLPEEES